MSARIAATPAALARRRPPAAVRDHVVALAFAVGVLVSVCAIGVAVADAAGPLTSPHRRVRLARPVPARGVTLARSLPVTRPARGAMRARPLTRALPDPRPVHPRTRATG